MKSGKYIIGLTGNIATGKSIVRRMLQELGASTIDADGLVHALQRPGTRVYREIVELFGSFILNPDATINRKRLGGIAFSLPEAMQALEKITHPAVRKQILYAIKKAPTPVVVVEAIKLLDGELSAYCDEIWVVTAPEDVQVLRLMTRRKMSSEEALQRVRAQTPQAEKVAQADVVIDNSGDLVRTWNEVVRHYNKIPLVAEMRRQKAAQPVAEDTQKVVIRRAKRDDLSPMATLLRQASARTLDFSEAQMMERFFSKGYFLAEQNGQILGIIGWRAENLVAGIDDFFVRDADKWENIGSQLLDAVEQAAKELSCEVGLLFIHRQAASAAKKVLRAKSYQPQTRAKLTKIWREAAEEWQEENTGLLLKQYRKQPINVPL